jgi:hypothetical protein
MYTAQVMRFPEFTRSPWFAFGALALAFELPGLLSAEPFRPSGEPVVLAGLWLSGSQVRFGAMLRMFAVSAGVLLFLHRVDQAAFQYLMGDQPLLYDQTFLLRHLFVLISDLWSLESALVALGVVAAVMLGSLAFRHALLRLSVPREPSERRTLIRGMVALLPVLAIGSVVPTAGPRLVRWQTVAFADDVDQSLRIYGEVQAQLGGSEYRAYDRIALDRKPDIYLFWVESYGRVIAERAALRARWAEHVSIMEARLAARGWHAASAFSRAPIMGGRSWLAEATVLTGTEVAHQAVFHHLIGAIDRVPHLVGFLDRQGYETVLLAPSDRERPGVKNVNYYGYDRAVRFFDLGYRGPKIGWGLVPDQYSLGHTHEHVLRGVQHPLLLNFHMVSSHAPWKQVPSIVPDWRALNDGSGVPERDILSGSATAELKRFLRGTRVFPRMGELREEIGERYRDTVLYGLEVVESYLVELTGDALVIVLGDHQPPFLADHVGSFDSVIHVLARDSHLLEELREQGFRDGLLLGATERTATTHAGLFSLLVRALARCCSPGSSLPAYRREGVATFSGRK